MALESSIRNSSNSRVHSASDDVVSEKKWAGAEAKEVPEEDQASIHWHTGVLAQFPWLGFAAILTILVCISFSIVILVTSNGKTVEEWPVKKLPHWVKDEWKEYTQLKPSVALAVTNTVCNLALAIAIGKGVVIAWWRRALKGSTVNDLHQSWAYTTSTLDLLTAGTKFNLIALAALAAKIALVDSILLQKATTLIPSGLTNDKFKVNIPILQELPAGSLGNYDSIEDENRTGAWSYDFGYSVFQHMETTDFISFEDAKFEGYDTLCKGFCSIKVPGFGFRFSCAAEELGEKFAVNPSTASRNNSGIGNSSIDSLPPFLSVISELVLPGKGYPLNNGTLLHSTNGMIVISTSYWESQPEDLSDLEATECTGQEHQLQCWLEPSVINYGIYIQDPELVDEKTGAEKLSTSSAMSIKRGISPWPQNSFGNEFLPESLAKGQLAPLDVVGPAYLPWKDEYLGNILAVTNFLNSFYDGSASLKYSENVGYVVENHNEDLSVGISGFWAGFKNRYNHPTSRDACRVDNANPAPWLIEKLNNLMLRTSISLAIELGADGPHIDPKNVKTVIADGSLDDAVFVQILDTLKYQTSTGFMWGAVGTTLFCILCVLPSYWGFWQLGRKVTLGPMEIASAFQAPALQHPGLSNGGEVDELLYAVGGKRVQYGDVEGSGRLAVAEAEVVQRIAAAKK